MKTLVLWFSSKRLSWSLFVNEAGGPPARAASDAIADIVFDERTIHDALCMAKCRFPGMEPEMLAIRVPYAGAGFRKPVIADSRVLQKLEELVPQSPIHMPRSVVLIRACQKLFAGVPIALFFETSFFTNLPGRECLYAIETMRQGKPEARRFGFHGLFHDAACNAALQRWTAQGNRKRPAVLSAYLGNHSEIAGAVGNTALTVTSGASPLEGLPGSTMCGDVDPAVILEIAERKKWGPEQINTVISRQSGILGLTGEPSTLEDIFTKDKEAFLKARAVIQYRMLCAAGAAAAALGTVDLIVFSGPFAHLGNVLGPYLVSRLFTRGPKRHTPVEYFILPQSLDEIVAQGARTVARTARTASHKTAAVPLQG
jgi:acetate kinase